MPWVDSPFDAALLRIKSRLGAPTLSLRLLAGDDDAPTGFVRLLLPLPDLLRGYIDGAPVWTFPPEADLLLASDVNDDDDGLPPAAARPRLLQPVASAGMATGTREDGLVVCLPELPPPATSPTSCEPSSRIC